MRDNLRNNSMPEDLQYREEFAERGLRRLHRARRRLFWRKVGALVVCVSLLATWLFNQHEYRSTPSNVDPSAPNEILSAWGDIEDLKSSHTEPAFDYLDDSLNSVETNTALQVKTFGLGGSVSSGAELPGRKSNANRYVGMSAEVTYPNVPVISSNSDVDQHAGSCEQATASAELSSSADYMNIPVRSIPLVLSSRSSRENSFRTSSCVSAHRHHLSLSIGALLSKGFGTVNDWIHPDPFARLSLNHRLKFGDEIYAAVGVMRVSGIDRPVEVLQESITTGYSQRRITYHTDALYFLTADIQWSHSVWPGWKISAGPSAMLVLQGVNHVSEQISGSFDTPESHVSQAHGYVKGFQQFAFGLNAGIEHALSSQLSIGMDASFGMTDITKTGVFTQENRDRNGYIGCHIRQQLF